MSAPLAPAPQHWQHHFLKNKFTYPGWRETGRHSAAHRDCGSWPAPDLTQFFFYTSKIGGRKSTAKIYGRPPRPPIEDTGWSKRRSGFKVCKNYGYDPGPDLVFEHLKWGKSETIN